MKIRIRWSTGIYLVSLFLISFTILELICRLGVLPPTKHYKIQNTIKTKDDFRSRVMILGDSFSLDYEKMYTSYLKEYFNSRGISVLNLAQNGTGPAEYLAALEKYGSVYNPDLIIANYYVGNDLTDTMKSNNPSASWKTQVKKIIGWSYLGAYLLEVKHHLAIRRGMKQLEERYKERSAQLDLRNIFLMEFSKAHPDHLVDNLLINSKKAQDLWEVNKKILLTMRDIALRLDAEFIIIVFPRSLQIDNSHLEFFRRLGFDTPENLLLSEVPQTLSMNFCRQNDINCYDLLSEFQKSQGKQYYLLNDDHLNDSGNLFAFELVKRELELRKLPRTRSNIVPERLH